MYPTSLSGNVLPDLQGEGEGEGRSAKALKLQYITNYLLLGVEHDIYTNNLHHCGLEFQVQRPRPQCKLD